MLRFCLLLLQKNHVKQSIFRLLIVTLFSVQQIFLFYGNLHRP